MLPVDSRLLIAERVDAACDCFEREWRAGRGPSIEECVAAAPESDRAELRQQLLALELELQGNGEADTSINGSSVRSPNMSDANRTVPLPFNPDGIPATIGRFEVRGILGNGAFGRVYRALDPQLGREVAVKVPLETAVGTAGERERFLKEARAAATINHPNVCQIHEVGQHDARPYIVMALVPGQSLADELKVRKSPMAEKQAALVVRKVALALAAAHEKGVVHRDLKPANVMLDRERKDVVVMDFGLARGPRLADARGTQSGVIMGTPAYMSPEQASGASKDVGPSGDVYSLGVVLYELLTGTRPFAGTATEVIGQILHVEPEKPSLRRAGIDPRLEAVCLKAMAKRPQDRFASMNEFAKAIDAILRTVIAAGGATDTVRVENTKCEGEASASKGNMTDVFAALAIEPKLSRDETAAAVEAAIRKHRTPRWAIVAVGLAMLFGFTALGAVVFFTRSKVNVDLTVVLKDVDLSDKSLSFFLDDEPVAAETLAQPVELKSGVHIFTVKRGKQIVTRIEFRVKGDKKPAVTVEDITPRPIPLNSRPSGSPLDVLDAEAIPEPTLVAVYGNASAAPPELVALYSRIRPGRPKDYFAGFTIAPDGKTLAVSMSHTDTIETYDLTTGQRVTEIPSPDPREATPFFIWLRFSPDGKTLYGCRRDGMLIALSFPAGRERWRQAARGNWSLPALSPDGLSLACVTRDNGSSAVQILDARTGKPRAAWAGLLKGGTPRMGFSPDSRALAVTSGHTLHVVNASNGSDIRILDNLLDVPYIPDFGRDSQRIYHSYGGEVGESYFVETELHTGKVREYRFSPGGCGMSTVNPRFPILASYGAHALQLWDADTGPGQTPYLVPLGCPASKIEFTPDGRYVVVAAAKGIFVFRLPVDRPLATRSTTEG